MDTENKDRKSAPDSGTEKKPGWDWDDDKVIFIPDEDYYAIQRAIRNMEQAQVELRKVAEEIKRIENG